VFCAIIRSMVKYEKNTKRRLLYLVAAIIWGAIIFYLSSIPSLASGLPSWQDFILRKLAHVAVFFMFTFLIAKSLDSTQRHYLLFAIIAGIFYAFIDELHQLYTPGRVGAAQDILIDTFGVFLAMWFYVKKQKNLFD